MLSVENNFEIVRLAEIVDEPLLHKAAEDFPGFIVAGTNDTLSPRIPILSSSDMCGSEVSNERIDRIITNPKRAISRVRSEVKFGRVKRHELGSNGPVVYDARPEVGNVEFQAERLEVINDLGINQVFMLRDSVAARAPRLVLGLFMEWPKDDLVFQAEKYLKDIGTFVLNLAPGSDESA